MDLDLDFEICQISCDDFRFTDTTCFHKYANPYFCTNGYNVPGGIDVNDLGQTLFTWVMPDGSIVTDADLGYQVGTKARFYLTMSAGTTGSVGVSVDGLLIGGAEFAVDINTTLNALVLVINARSENTRWQAFITQNDDFVIEHLDYGVNYNDKLFTYISTGDIAFTYLTDVSAGANGFTDTHCFGMAEIYGQSCSDVVIPCGIHRITYKVFDKFNVEVKRITKYILVIWKAQNAIKSWIMLSTESDCGCSEKMDERILELRLMIEKAQIQFENFNYVCAQKTVDKMKKLAMNICLDC